MFINSDAITAWRLTSFTETVRLRPPPWLFVTLSSSSIASYSPNILDPSSAVSGLMSFVMQTLCAWPVSSLPTAKPDCDGQADRGPLHRCRGLSGLGGAGRTGEQGGELGDFGADVVIGADADGAVLAHEAKLGGVGVEGGFHGGDQLGDRAGRDEPAGF